MKLLSIFAAFFVLTTLSSFKISDRRDDWHFIGDKIAAFGPDRDVLAVKGNDNYRQIKIRVTGAPLFIQDMDIHFDNGEKMDVSLRQRFAQGAESRVIDLPGGSRNLTKITFKYSSIGRQRGHARVAVWGQR